MDMKIGNAKLGRLAVLPLAAMMVASVAVGCKSDKDDSANVPPPAATPNASGTSTPGTHPGTTTPGTAPGGPGGTMMNKPSANPMGTVGDGVITAKVKSDLIGDTRVGATSINVDTKSGTVVLRGSVKSAAAKQAALSDARKMQGVKNVIDQLSIKP